MSVIRVKQKTKSNGRLEGAECETTAGSGSPFVSRFYGDFYINAGQVFVSHHLKFYYSLKTW